MPSPAEYIRQLVEVYAAVERDLLERIATRLAQGLDRDDWADRKLAEVAAIRRTAQQLADRLTATTAGLPERAVAEAARRGDDAAIRELRGLVDAPTTADLDAAAIAALAADLTANLRPAHLSIVRTTVDAYRDVIGRVAGSSIAGATSRRDAAQRALWEFADRGITSFTDQAGRRWDITSYAEMATRTASQRALVDSHVDRLAASGVGLVQVTDSPRECLLCRPWEGEVLAIIGGAGDRAVEHATRDGELVTVRVTATLAAARAAGLFHPNCTHTVRAYLPGVTKPLRNTEWPEGDEARQRLRALERRVRKWRAREAAALDAHARARAKAGLRAAQDDLRAHVNESGAKRQPHRERLGVAR